MRGLVALAHDLRHRSDLPQRPLAERPEGEQPRRRRPAAAQVFRAPAAPLAVPEAPLDASRRSGTIPADAAARFVQPIGDAESDHAGADAVRATLDEQARAKAVQAQLEDGFEDDEDIPY